MSSPIDPGAARLPDDAHLVHIGPHKTGTTALQASLWAARASMLEQGVRHAGRTRNPVGAARAVTGQRSSYSDEPPSMRDWHALVREVREAREPRVVVSSEFLAHADTPTAARIVHDLDPARVHVVVTLRPLARVIPSMWQQNVQAGVAATFDRWLRQLFPAGPRTPRAQFWRLHRHDALLERWAGVVGPDRMTAVVVDEADHGFLLRSFEALLGLRELTLAIQHDLANRSLTREEAEAVRMFNAAFKAAHLDRALHARVMRYGAAQHMKERARAPEERPVELPAWALERVGEVARDMTARIESSGVRVLGDLASLSAVPGEDAHRTWRRADEQPDDAAGPPSIAAAMAMGLVVSAGAARQAPTAPEGDGHDRDRLEVVPTYLVAGTIGTRVHADAALRWNWLRGRVRRRLVRGAGSASQRERAGDGYRRAGSEPAPDVPRPMTVPAPDRTSLLLPEGTRLVHIGPPKTGTTTIQGAFHEARAATEAQGVHYAGRYRHSIAAVQSVMHRQGFYLEGGSPSIFHWRRLLRDIRRSNASRVVLSSEFLADAQADDIRRIVEDLDLARVHVVVTLRPLAKIIPSQWQQYIQSASKYSFDDWLNAMLNREHSKITPSFWHRHRHDRLVERWAEVVGPEHVTVVVLDEGDRDRVLRVFEELTGLREGTLVAQPDGENRSLTLPEVEAVRAFNVAFHAEGLTRPVHSRVMNFGAARYLQRATPPPDAPRIEMPQWALDKAGAIAREMVDTIAASGVRVVGDLESLAAVPTSRLEGDRQPPVTVPPGVAATLAMGVLYSSGLATEPAPGAKPGGAKPGFGTSSGPAIRAEPLELVRVPTSELFGILARRSRTAVTSRVRRVARRR